MIVGNFVVLYDTFDVSYYSRVRIQGYKKDGFSFKDVKGITQVFVCFEKVTKTGINGDSFYFKDSYSINGFSKMT